MSCVLRQRPTQEMVNWQKIEPCRKDWGMKFFTAGLAKGRVALRSDLGTVPSREVSIDFHSTRMVAGAACSGVTVEAESADLHGDRRNA